MDFLHIWRFFGELLPEVHVCFTARFDVDFELLEDVLIANLGNYVEYTEFFVEIPADLNPVELVLVLNLLFDELFQSIYRELNVEWREVLLCDVQLL